MSLSEGLEIHLHYGYWGYVFIWFLLFASFIAFLPFHRKSQRRSTSIYLAFIVASAFEMFGIPLSLYFMAWAFGVSVPLGFLWGHTLAGQIGYWGMSVGYVLNFVGGILIILGWRSVYRSYWSRDVGEGRLVTDGIYAYIRHPQYTGFILMTLGLLIHWATIPLLVMWPLLVLQYYRLAKREEKDMEAEFGDEYREYRERVPMFIPFPLKNRDVKAGGEDGALRVFLLRSFIGGFALFSAYLAVLTLGESFEHAISQFLGWWFWVLPPVVGFGVQMGLFLHLKDLAGSGGMRGSRSPLVVGGGTSATSMVACCLHHVADLIPLVGISAATLLLSKYQAVFMALGVLANFVGSVIVLEHIQRFSSSTSEGGVMRTLSRYDLSRIKKISIAASAAVFVIVLASSQGLLPAYGHDGEAVELVEERNGVTFAVMPVDVDDGLIGFRMRIDTHQGSLSFDMVEVAALRVEDVEYKPLLWEGSPPGGHHRGGVLVFPRPPETGAMTLLIRNVYDVPERIFEWGSGSSGSNSIIYAMGGISAIVAVSAVLVLRSKKQIPYDTYDSFFEEEYRKFKETSN